MADLIISNGTLVTMNPDRVIITDGAVAVEGNRIVAVGKSDEVAADHSAPLTIDASERLIIPGLIDGHNHPFQYLSKGIGDDVDIMTWLYRRVYPYEAAVTAEEAYIGALGNYAQMIRSGTTCFNDPGGYHADSLAQAASDIGIRGIINRSTRDIADDDVPIPEAHFEDRETALAESEALINRWNGAADGRLRAWTSLRYIPNCSDELCRAVKDLADRTGVGIHTHVAAVMGENELITEKFGKRSLQRYYDLGLFAPNLYCIHMGYPNEQEVTWLADHDVKVAHCPSASMHGSYGVIQNKMMPVMAEAGISIALGTDSATAGRFLDMVRVMYLAACAHKDAYADPLKMGARKALEMATIEGARACLWEDEIGSLEVGKKADIVVVDMGGLHWVPDLDPVNSLVYAANGADVETVVIDGRVVMRDRILQTVDERMLRREIVQAGAAIHDRAGLASASPWPTR
jgi:cytosine/adenosine deaminase-related metal-dependent hydrolase